MFSGFEKKIPRIIYRAQFSIQRFIKEKSRKKTTLPIIGHETFSKR
jgi:hypothetical protein